MNESKLDKLRTRLYKAQERKLGLEVEIDDLRSKIGMCELGDFPQEPGWYEDGDGNITRLNKTSDGRVFWDDGWGNALDGGAEFPLPVPPLTRLVPVNE